MIEIKLDKELLTQWRHELHAIPEMAFQENKTAQYVEQKLKSFGVKIYPRMAGTGVIASLSCGKSRKSIALRADLDALSIVEKSSKEYCSTHQESCMPVVMMVIPLCCWEQQNICQKIKNLTA